MYAPLLLALCAGALEVLQQQGTHSTNQLRSRGQHPGCLPVEKRPHLRRGEARLVRWAQGAAAE